eukprot:scaffold923_cov171-Amphora_coffeaeformis.AAC.8
MPARPLYQDGNVDVYFVERDGELFRYVYAFIVTGCVLLPPSLPPFGDSPQLWRALRAEAEFLGLDRLLQLLQTTFTCSQDTHGDRGVLYWLGTNKGQQPLDYQNPLTTRVIDIQCWLDTVALPADPDAMERKVSKARDRFVQYRVPCDDIFADRSSSSTTTSSATAVVGYALSVSYASLAGLGGFFKYHVVKPVLMDLKSIRLRPTCFSLRSSGTGGEHREIHWQLEGSIDADSWQCLYSTVKNNGGTSPYLREISLDVKRSFLKTFREQRRVNYVELATEYVEAHHRHYWRIDPVPDAYFRYLRFVGTGGQQDELPQGTSLELYGDVFEE